MGLTKARSMGPLVAAVRRAGGSVTRLFRQAELPLSLVEQPDVLIPLRDQLKLLELAARETADEALPARLSLGGGVEHLGTFGEHVCSAPHLEVAIQRCNEHMSALLQSGTRLSLTRLGESAKWSYAFVHGVDVGRQKNELLALGYMLDLSRRYFGVPAGLIRAELPDTALPARREIEDLFGCGISRGPVAALIFPARYLAVPNKLRTGPAPAAQPCGLALPGAADLVAHVEHIIVLGLLEGRPREAWLCRRLGVSGRSLQRALAARDTSFGEILQTVTMRLATQQLSSSDAPITQIALRLGYSDPAHFTRAFARATGECPQDWRRRTKRACPGTQR